MGFLIRICFWFSLVLLLLPLDPEGSDGSVSAMQAFVAAREAIGDMAGICDRKPEVCETGAEAMQTIGVRAREGARIAIGMLQEAEHVEADAAPTGSVVAAH